MIASRVRDFIFIKTRKTGGTTLEIILSSWCGRSDICTPISPEDELTRSDYGGRPRNFRDWRGRAKYHSHMSAAAVKAALPRLWEGAYKFSIERHPYEKVISRAWFNIGFPGHGSTRDPASEIEKVISSREYLNFPLYTIDGQIAVDEVWDYANVSSRLEELAHQLGTRMPAQIPRAKSGFRKDRRSASEILTTSQRARIYEDARFEFELMGYEP